MRLIITFASLAIAFAPAFAKVPTFPKNTPYHEARPRLMKMGYAHAKFKRPEGFCAPYDDRCTQYPEAQFCSGTGHARCMFLWRLKVGELIEILTSGEEDPMFIKKSAAAPIVKFNKSVNIYVKQT